MSRPGWKVWNFGREGRALFLPPAACRPSSRREFGIEACWSSLVLRLLPTIWDVRKARQRIEIFPACQIHDGGGASPLPTQSRAELQTRRRQWDKTSEVPAVHGALRWWALSKAEKPHSWKQYWRGQARSRGRAASMPERQSEIPVPKPAATRWASALPPLPQILWATVTPLSIVPARWNSRMTCAPHYRR